MLVVELAYPHGVSCAGVRPQRLLLAAAVVGDDGVRGGQDRLSRAIVLLELDHVRLLEVPLEVEDVADVGAAEGVDRLIVVADDAEVAVVPGDELEPPILRAVGVLVLVDEDVPEGVLVAFADLGEQRQQVDATEQQVVEVHRVHGVDPPLVEIVDVGRGLLEERPDLLAVSLGVDQPILRIGDLALQRARREALGVDVERLDALLDQPHRVGVVVDREAARVTELVTVGPQHPGASRVEGHHPHRPRARTDEPFDALRIS